MYEKHFRFTENPFTIAPNPRYLYMSKQHREALAHLSYGLKEENGGFVLLTGEVGTGKTTLLRCLLNQVLEDVKVALVLNPNINEIELLETICDEFEIDYPAGVRNKELIDILNHWLLAAHMKGIRAVVVIEEAQNFSVSMLEQLRLLTNLETNERKLLQIVLIGQPELLHTLEKPELRQFSQRIVVRYHLNALKDKEIHAYISHRISICNGDTSIFPPAVMSKIAYLSKGIPRLINLLCDRCLLGCYTENKNRVNMKILKQSVNEVFSSKNKSLRLINQPLLKYALGSVVISTITLLTLYFIVNPQSFWDPVEHLLDVRTSFVTGNKEEKNAISGQISLPTEIAQAESNDKSMVPKSNIQLTSNVAEPQIWEQVKKNGTWTESMAYEALLKSWLIDIEKESGLTPCDFAQSKGLNCWHRRGRFHDVYRLNRPVLLNFISEKGTPFYAVLLSIQDGYVRLGIANKVVEVLKTSVENFWTGEYTILWKRPQGFIRTILPGDSSVIVKWSQDQFALMEGRSVANKSQSDIYSNLYDIGLVAKVRKFQRRCGLVVDGLLGKETIIMLNSINRSTPVLSNTLRSACLGGLNI